MSGNCGGNIGIEINWCVGCIFDMCIFIGNNLFIIGVRVIIYFCINF